MYGCGFKNVTDDVYVELLSCVITSETAYLSLGYRPPKFTSLILSKCGIGLLSLNLSHSYQAVADNECLYVISERCPNLQYLDISVNIHIYNRNLIDDTWGQVTDEAIIKLSENCTKLKEIHLHRHTFLTQLSIDALLTNCPQIEEIDTYFTAIPRDVYFQAKREELKRIGRYVRLLEQPLEKHLIYNMLPPEEDW